MGNVLHRQATLLRGEGLAALTPGKRFVDMLGVSAEFETNLRYRLPLFQPIGPLFARITNTKWTGS
jgi:hypothetical protein